MTQSDASSRYVPSRLWSVLAYPVTPNDPVVDDLAPGYAADRNMANLLSAIFMHPRFTSTQAMQGLVKQPTEYVVGALRALGVTPADLQAKPAGDPRASLPAWDRFSSIRRVSGDGRRTTTGSRPRRRWPDGSSPTAWPGGATSRPSPTPLGSDRVEAAAELLAVPRWSDRRPRRPSRRAVVDPPTLVTLALVSPEYVTN